MDYSPCPEREIWPFLKGSHISEIGETTPTKTGVHELDINPYLHEFFQVEVYVKFTCTNFGRCGFSVFAISID